MRSSLSKTPGRSTDMGFNMFGSLPPREENQVRLSGRIARYKLPRSVDFVATLPRLDNGKLYKHKLREQYRSAAENNSLE